MLFQQVWIIQAVNWLVVWNRIFCVTAHLPQFVAPRPHSSVHSKQQYSSLPSPGRITLWWSRHCTQSILACPVYLFYVVVIYNCSHTSIIFLLYDSLYLVLFTSINTSILFVISTFYFIIFYIVLLVNKRKIYEWLSFLTPQYSFIIQKCRPQRPALNPGNTLLRWPWGRRMRIIHHMQTRH